MSKLEQAREAVLDIIEDRETDMAIAKAHVKVATTIDQLYALLDTYPVIKDEAMIDLNLLLKPTRKK